MRTDRHRQLAFTCDAEGEVVFAGGSVRITCAECGEPVASDFAVARVFETGAITVFDAGGKQRYACGGRFTVSRAGAPA